MNNILDQ